MSRRRYLVLDGGRKAAWDSAGSESRVEHGSAFLSGGAATAGQHSAAILPTQKSQLSVIPSLCGGRPIPSPNQSGLIGMKGNGSPYGGKPHAYRHNRSQPGFKALG